MTIKKRLRASNLLMLLIPALLILLTAGATTGLGMLFYHGEIGELGENQESVALARDLVGQYLQVWLKGGNAGELSNLVEILDGLDFHLLIEQDGAIVQSNLTQADYDAVQRILGEFPNAQGPLLLAAGETALVRDSAGIGGSKITLLAVNSSVEMTGSLGALLRRIFRQYFLLVLGVFLLVVSLSNAFLSSRVAKSVLTPLALLGEGARRIRDGDLETALDYDGTDEFREVFDDFNAMRQRLRDSVHRQVQYEEERRALIAEMSHDLRTPLTTIGGYVEGLRDGVATTPEKQARYFEIILSKVRSMDALVDRLFLLSKLETGHFPFRFEEVGLSGYLAQYVRSVAEEFSSKGQTVLFEDAGAGPSAVLLDPEQMRNVLDNLLENSVKYRLGTSGVSRIRLFGNDEALTISVSDDGPGVEEDSLPRLFESFYRGDKARSNPGEGSGLGLAIVRRIIEAHHGGIHAENRDGLTVLIQLDRRAPDEKNFDSGR